MGSPGGPGESLIRINVGSISGAPEAAVGGPIAAVRDGDIINIDTDADRLDLEVPPAEIAARLKSVQQPPPRFKLGVFAKYAAVVSSASDGAVTTRRS